MTNCKIGKIVLFSCSAFLTTLLKSVSTDAWIGLNDINWSRRFLWTDGSGVYYTNWATGSPKSTDWQYNRGGEVHQTTFCSPFPSQPQSSTTFSSPTSVHPLPPSLSNVPILAWQHSLHAAAICGSDSKMATNAAHCHKPFYHNGTVLFCSIISVYKPKLG